MAIKFSDLEVSNFDIEQIKLSNNTTLLLPRLNNKEVPCIILPKVTLSHYGVPKANAKKSRLIKIECSSNYRSSRVKHWNDLN